MRSLLIVVPITALVAGSAVWAYMVWNNRHNTGPEVLRDAGAASVDISREITRQLEEEHRAAEEKRRADAASPSPLPSVSPSPRSAPSPGVGASTGGAGRGGSDPYARLDAIVDDAHQYNLAHGEVARQLAGPKSDGPDERVKLQPLSVSLGPLMKADGARLGLVPSIEIDGGQSDDVRRGARKFFDLSQQINLNDGVQAVLLDPTQPEGSGSGNHITARTKEGKTLIEVVTPDHHTHFISMSDYDLLSPVPGYRRLR
jgi:hypothetical protein